MHHLTFLQIELHVPLFGPSSEGVQCILHLPSVFLSPDFRLVFGVVGKLDDEDLSLSDPDARLLMQMVNSFNPRMVPFGTPYVAPPHVDKLPQTKTTCCLSVNHVSMRVSVHSLIEL